METYCSNGLLTHSHQEQLTRIWSSVKEYRYLTSASISILLSTELFCCTPYHDYSGVKTQSPLRCPHVTSCIIMFYLIMFFLNMHQTCNTLDLDERLFLFYYSIYYNILINIWVKYHRGTFIKTSWKPSLYMEFILYLIFLNSDYFFISVNTRNVFFEWLNTSLLKCNFCSTKFHGEISSYIPLIIPHMVGIIIWLAAKAIYTM